MSVHQFPTGRPLAHGREVSQQDVEQHLARLDGHVRHARTHIDDVMQVANRLSEQGRDATLALQTLHALEHLHAALERYRDCIARL